MARHFSFQSISLPLTGTADAASGITVAAMEKKSSHVGTAGAVSASRAGKNHAALRPRVLRVGTTLPAIARTFTPCIQAISSRSGVFVVVETATKIILEHKNCSNRFHSPPSLWGLPCSCRPSSVLSVHPVLRARAYSDWSPLTVPCTRTRTLRFRGSAKSTIAVGSAVALTVPLVPLLFVSSIVLTDARSVHFPICPVTNGRRHSPVVFPLSCVLRALLRFFDVGSFCAAGGNFPRLRRLPARQWSYHCTGRSSSTYWAMRGIIFVRFAGGHPFCTAVVTASRCLASRARLAPRKTLFRTCPRANAAGSAARALSSAHLVEPRHAHRF